MKISERALKWAMRLYPPLFFQRIWVKKFHANFTGVDVKVYISLLNRNYNSSIFGGTIFSAADPFYPILFDQIFRKKGIKTQVWLKSSSVKYIKPARTSLNFSIQLNDEEVKQAELELNNEGKYVAKFTVNIYNKQHETCAIVENEIYIRDLNFDFKST